MPKLGSFTVRSIRVPGSGEKRYTVTLVDDVPVACTCPHFEHRAGPEGQSCKHMKTRVGPSAIGTTRCESCRVLLSCEDIDAQPLAKGDPATRRCESCRSSDPR